MNGQTNDREQPAAVPRQPPLLHELTAGGRWMRNLVGESGCAVYRLARAGKPDLYLKHGVGAAAEDLLAEMCRMRWLAQTLPVPRIQHFVAAEEESWLLMTALPGRTAYQWLSLATASEQLQLVAELTGFLRRLHQQPADECPYQSHHLLRLAHARQRLAADLIDTEDFDEEHAGWTAEQLWQALQEMLPMAMDTVVTHGDYSLDNILIEDGRVTGCIDLGRVGTADRYQDLAILWNCLGEFSPELQAHMLQCYGIHDIDTRKLRFHLLLDECF